MPYDESSPRQTPPTAGQHGGQLRPVSAVGVSRRDTSTRQTKMTYLHERASHPDDTSHPPGTSPAGTLQAPLSAKKLRSHSGRSLRVAVLQESLILAAKDADHVAVLAILALHANKSTGSCWPTQGLIARMLGRSRPWVNRVISELVELGIVVRTHRTRDDGGDRACLYTLVTPVEQSQAHDSVVSDADTRCHGHDSVKDLPEQTKKTHPARPAPDVNVGQLDLQTPEPGWQPSDMDLCWATDRHPDVALPAAVEWFVLRCRANGYRYRDLGAAWRSWLADDSKAGGRFGAAKPSSGGGRGSAAQAKFDAWAGVVARAGSTRHAVA